MTTIIHKHATLRCPAEYAFALFTDSRLLNWLAPFAEVDPVLGGGYELFWSPEDRHSNSTLGCRITAIEPGAVLAFDWRGPDQHGDVMNTADPLTHVSILFRPRPDTRTPCTDVHLLHTGWGSGEQWEAARRWQELAWVNALTELEKVVNATGLDNEIGSA